MVVIKTDTETIRCTEHDLLSPPSQKDANGNYRTCHFDTANQFTTKFLQTHCENNSSICSCVSEENHAS
jgi:hypothetical protein